MKTLPERNKSGFLSMMEGHEVRLGRSPHGAMASLFCPISRRPSQRVCPLIFLAL